MQRSSQNASLVRSGSVLVILALALATLEACSGHHGSRSAVSTEHRAIFSPNGELLSGGPLGHPTCLVAYGQWFDHLDPLKSGTFNHDAFLADAETQFKTMDLDHDGYITAAELTKYRARFDFDPSLGFALERKSGDDDSTKRFAKKRDPDSPDWAVSSWTPDSADPVMSADRSLKFRVSHEDYMVQAEDIFRKLDSKHDGQIPRERILAVCPKDPLDEEHHSWF